MSAIWRHANAAGFVVISSPEEAITDYVSMLINDSIRLGEDTVLVVVGYAVTPVDDRLGGRLCRASGIGNV